MTKPVSYSDAGVSIDTANEAVARIKGFAKATFNSRTLTEIGSFGGMFDGRFPDMSEPVLVASADGVGTKLKIAFDTNVHTTIGQDLVNHCVGDILVQGARPLFFLDYFATGRLSADVTASVVEGLSIACRENGCVLLGGETAEMPGFYADGEYDLAGFVVGVVDKKNVIDGKSIDEGDVVLGLPSTGLHTNGYSLARKLFFEIGEFHHSDDPDELNGDSVADVLLTPHKSYLPELGGLIGTGRIKGLAHITGGGLLENIPRILPDGVSVVIDRSTWEVPPVFGLMQRLGSVEDREMFRTFNMGIGMAVICAKNDAASISEHIVSNGGVCIEIGKVTNGDGEVTIG
ncbi:MAG: phosphoribosylformylglycinamidine cyclo-ligase [Acidobacteria bacterium]|nr:MAG: phosphoribosylformylglycinamidine cyclo-ligase [Acidobacteriota bacterium]REJ98361.1 MAG: phosphoribosylformylglycinamidine cyclo-ligase [Acidobacteriota bacterium]REK17105.1 MAG: phosphoribosylformylglycinamidine cyclo-ligase [Acidobacteriota bacterium]REK43015.1 MAG: phosphoribosylformylglycinamidine cyclo-ligase [Acidobacteriota bacterium]